MSVTYHGILEGVRDARGRFIALAPVAIGTEPGLGLVSARSVPALRAGNFLTAARGAYRVIVEVFYRRRRPDGLHWRHALAATAFAIGPGGPVFVSTDPRREARVCAFPPGDFICGG